ncbi:MAG: HutP family protein [Clostridia bacterium]|nr:HutP family protein [Clostridia bacterium]
MLKTTGDSRDVARAAVMLAMTATREDEAAMKQELDQSGIQAVAVDYGGEFVTSVMKMVERAVVAAKREHVIGETSHEEGVVAGAAREALSQVSTKALGLNVGGKIGVARCGEHVAVAVFFAIGLVHLNEVCIGMGHRTIANRG